MCNLNLENANKVVEHEQMKLYKPFQRETFHNTTEKPQEKFQPRGVSSAHVNCSSPGAYTKGVFPAAATDQVPFQALLPHPFEGRTCGSFLPELINIAVGAAMLAWYFPKECLEGQIIRWCKSALFQWSCSSLRQARIWFNTFILLLISVAKKTFLLVLCMPLAVQWLKQVVLPAYL